ncbi:hypothetical protein FHX36_000900 [Modestobacter versicolor]|uniref:D-alanyl-D-alanine carboxypeptidase-like core domain-containing protein n=1 Tax=Modestobacter versicolor TaxID=429133 RepID=A0A839XX47_9ACTN|nr:hypothetical protein [Modestobacter versicolor]
MAAGLLVVLAAAVAVLGLRSLAGPSPLTGSPGAGSTATAATLSAVPPDAAPAAGSPGAAPPPADPPPGVLPRDGRTIDEADGLLPGGATVDDERPGVAALDPALLEALRRAAAAAADDGVTFSVTSGWRSAQYQEQLLREAVAEHGTAEEAARWVATPETSAHVSGEAVDVGPTDAMSWLSQHGAAHGLCQVYGNEPWHYELRPEAIGEGCPEMYDDPTQDPRMQVAGAHR